MTRLYDIAMTKLTNIAEYRMNFPHKIEEPRDFKEIL